jgi:hypothetical protein
MIQYIRNQLLAGCHHYIAYVSIESYLYFFLEILRCFPRICEGPHASLVSFYSSFAHFFFGACGK